MRTLRLAVAVGAALALIGPIEAHWDDGSSGESAYVLVDAASQRVLESRWDDLDHPLAIGSLIKPFTAVAYAETHRFAYPTFTCRGTADRCWLPSGHNRLGIVAAIAGSCNAYFDEIARRTTPEVLAARLQWFGIRTMAPTPTRASMVGFGDQLTLAPSAVVRGYLELVARAGQPGISPIIEGMQEAARSGTGRAVGAALHGADALVKTGTAPCRHARRATADGYTMVIYPADRPRLALLVQAHGRTGADSAMFAAELLTKALTSR